MRTKPEPYERPSTYKSDAPLAARAGIVIRGSLHLGLQEAAG